MSKKKLIGINSLLEFEDHWRSNYGGSIPGVSAIFHGKDMFTEFKDYSWIEMLYFSLKKVKPSEEATKFINGVFCMCFNYPDPRIWCNRVAALAGTTSSTPNLGVCAGSSVTEAQIYGGPTGIRAMDFLFRIKKAMENGEQLDEFVSSELKKNKAIFGYGRPVLPIDERVAPALELLTELNLHKREYISIALKVDDYLKKSRFKLNINIAGVFAAFCADENMSRDDINNLTIVCFSIGMLACYLDANNKNVGLLFPLRCNRISYDGHEKREW